MRFPRLYAAASLKPTKAASPRALALSFSAALCRGLIEAWPAFVVLLFPALCFPRFYAAASEVRRRRHFEGVAAQRRRGAARERRTVRRGGRRTCRSRPPGGHGKGAGVNVDALDTAVVDSPTVRLDRATDRMRLRETIAQARVPAAHPRSVRAPANGMDRCLSHVGQSRLLILDLFVRLHSVDGNDLAEMASRLAFLRELQRRYRAGVLVPACPQGRRHAPGTGVAGRLRASRPGRFRSLPAGSRCSARWGSGRASRPGRFRSLPPPRGRRHRHDGIVITAEQPSTAPHRVWTMSRSELGDDGQGLARRVGAQAAQDGAGEDAAPGMDDVALGARRRWPGARAARRSAGRSRRRGRGCGRGRHQCRAAHHARAPVRLQCAAGPLSGPPGPRADRRCATPPSSPPCGRRRSWPRRVRSGRRFSRGCGTPDLRRVISGSRPCREREPGITRTAPSVVVHPHGAVSGREREPGITRTALSLRWFESPPVGGLSVMRGGVRSSDRMNRASPRRECRLRDRTWRPNRGTLAVPGRGSTRMPTSSPDMAPACLPPRVCSDAPFPGDESMEVARSFVYGLVELVTGLAVLVAWSTTPAALIGWAPWGPCVASWSAAIACALLPAPIGDWAAPPRGPRGAWGSW